MGKRRLHADETGGAAPPRAEDPRACRLLSLDEAARYLGLGSRWAVRRLVVKGALPVVKIARKWRLDVEDLDARISAGRREASANAFIAHNLPRAQTRRHAWLFARSVATTPKASSVHTVPGARSSAVTTRP
jgi:excisionase family DNA binding protein